MRPQERINVALGIINWTKYLEYLEKEIGVILDKPALISSIMESYEKIRNYWLENPDERLTQVLVNMEFIPNYQGFWYYLEEVDYLIDEQGILPRNIMYWGTYGKNGDQPCTFKLIKDMSNAHIENIVNNYSTDHRVKQSYLDAFKNELEYREQNNIVINDTP